MGRLLPDGKEGRLAGRWFGVAPSDAYGYDECYCREFQNPIDINRRSEYIHHSMSELFSIAPTSEASRTRSDISDHTWKSNDLLQIIAATSKDFLHSLLYARSALLEMRWESLPTRTLNLICTYVQNQPSCLYQPLTHSLPQKEQNREPRWYMKVQIQVQIQGFRFRFK